MSIIVALSQTLGDVNPLNKMYQWKDDMNYYNIYVPINEKRGKVNVYTEEQGVHNYKFCYYLDINDLPSNVTPYYSEEQIEEAKNVVQNHMNFTDIQMAYIKEMFQIQQKSLQDELFKYYNEYQEKLQEENIKYQKLLQQIALKDQIIYNLNQTNESICIQYYDIQNQMNCLKTQYQNKQRNTKNNHSEEKVNVSQHPISQDDNDSESEQSTRSARIDIDVLKSKHSVQSLNQTKSDAHCDHSSRPLDHAKIDVLKSDQSAQRAKIDPSPIPVVFHKFTQTFAQKVAENQTYTPIQTTNKYMVGDGDIQRSNRAKINEEEKQEVNNIPVKESNEWEKVVNSRRRNLQRDVRRNPLSNVRNRRR
jgi:hypothetical protein